MNEAEFSTSRKIKLSNRNSYLKKKLTSNNHECYMLKNKGSKIIEKIYRKGKSNF